MLSSNVNLKQETIDAMGPVALRAALAGAFLTAVERRFVNEPTRDEIIGFVALVRERYVKPESLPPMLGEALLRAAARDEESLVEGISDDDMTRGQLLLTYGLIHDLGLSGAAYEDFLTEATTYAQEIIDDRAANG